MSTNVDLQPRQDTEVAWQSNDMQSIQRDGDCHPLLTGMPRMTRHHRCGWIGQHSPSPQASKTARTIESEEATVRRQCHTQEQRSLWLCL